MSSLFEPGVAEAWVREAAGRVLPIVSDPALIFVVAWLAYMLWIFIDLRRNRPGGGE